MRITRRHIIYHLCSLAVAVVGFASLMLVTLWIDQRTFAFLASDPTVEMVEKTLGKPRQVFPAGESWHQRGWPRQRIDRHEEIWEYGGCLGRLFYVFINRSKDQVVYVFSPVE